MTGELSEKGIFRTTACCLGIALFMAFSSVTEAAGPAPAQSNPATFHPGYYAFIPSHQVIPSSVLNNDDFVGMKIKYTWRDLEVGPGQYDFSAIERHLEILENAGKRLWLQVEYIQWSANALPNVPEYMWSDPSYGGKAPYHGTYERTVQSGGWYPLYWNTKVRQRLVDMIMALGLKFGREAYIEGFSIPETAADRGADGFSCEAYQETLKQMAVAAKVSFGDNKSVLQMINYACFDLEDYAVWLNSQGIGIGTPDIYRFKATLTDTVYPLMLKYANSVPVGPDVQWANYERNDMSVAEILDFAIENTNPYYMFWRIRQPYFDDELVPAIWRTKLPRAEAFYDSGTAATQAAPRPPVLQ